MQNNPSASLSANQMGRMIGSASPSDTNHLPASLSAVHGHPYVATSVDRLSNCQTLSLILQPSPYKFRTTSVHFHPSVSLVPPHLPHFHGWGVTKLRAGWSVRRSVFSRGMYHTTVPVEGQCACTHTYVPMYGAIGMDYGELPREHKKVQHVQR